MSTRIEAGRQHGVMPMLSPGARLMLGGLTVGWAALGSLWLASALTGASGWGQVTEPAVRLARGQVPGVLTIVVAVLILLVVGWGVVRLGRLLRPAAAMPVGMASREEIRELAGVDAARAAAAYPRRRSVESGRLNLATCAVNELGWQPGHVREEPVVLTNESQTAVIGPTGMGKTRYALRGAAHDTVGPLVITTTKLSDFTAIIPHRETMGRVFVWDPLNAWHYPTRTIWDPVAGCVDGEVAHARARAFTGESDGGGDSAAQFFGDSAALVFTRLLMAAALDGKTMRDVRRWASRLRRSGAEPVSILREKLPEEPEWADTLEHSMTDGKTTENLQMTITLDVEPLMPAKVLRSLVPDPMDKTAMLFDPDDFVRSTDTLILVTDDNARVNVSELTTMLLSEVMDAAKLYAAELGGPLDPPMRVVADEVANVAPLPKLPSMLSDSRGAGIHWIIALQSLAAVKSRWGAEPGEVILSNLSAVLVLGGLQDTEALARFASLAGKSEVIEHTGTQGGGRDGSQTWSVNERDVLRPEEIAHLGSGEALLQFRNARPMIVTLTPYEQR